MVAINKAPNTHDEILLGAEENTSGANVTRRIHQQRSRENKRSTEAEKSWQGEAKETKRGVQDVGLSTSANLLPWVLAKQKTEDLLNSIPSGQPPT